MGDNGIRTHMKKSMSFSKSSLAAYKVISAIHLMVSKIYLYRFMRLNIDQITVYQSLFINKANVNRGSRNGMTCSDKPLHVLKEIDFARFSLQQFLSNYFSFKT